MLRGHKDAFVAEFPDRVCGNAAPIICGEMNIVRTNRKDMRAVFDSGFAEVLRRSKVSVILNPCHTYMTRPEMKSKREALSKGHRSVLSVWSRGHKKPESLDPWTAFSGGRRMPVIEIPFGGTPECPEIRIGICKIPTASPHNRALQP